MSCSKVFFQRVQPITRYQSLLMDISYSISNTLHHNFVTCRIIPLRFKTNLSPWQQFGGSDVIAAKCRHLGGFGEQRAASCQAISWSVALVSHAWYPYLYAVHPAALKFPAIHPDAPHPQQLSFFHVPHLSGPDASQEGGKQATDQVRWVGPFVHSIWLQPCGPSLPSCIYTLIVWRAKWGYCIHLRLKANCELIISARFSLKQHLFAYGTLEPSRSIIALI